VAISISKGFNATDAVWNCIDNPVIILLVTIAVEKEPMKELKKKNMNEVLKQLLMERIGRIIDCLNCHRKFDWGTSFLKDENFERARYNQFYCDKCWEIIKNSTL
jgi:hypothetical protein